MNSSKRQFSLLSKGNKIISGALAALVAASLLALPRASSAAPAVPSPGDSLPRPAGQGSTALENDTIETQEAAAEGARFTLTGIQVEHEGMELAEEGLSAITSPLLGREITASELNAAVEQLTQFARKSYPAAIAYIPEQTAREGKLLIRFEPGRFDKVQIEAGSVLKEFVAHRPLAGLRTGGIIEAGSLEESLRNLRDIPGNWQAATWTARSISTWAAPGACGPIPRGKSPGMRASWAPWSCATTRSCRGST